MGLIRQVKNTFPVLYSCIYSYDKRSSPSVPENLSNLFCILQNLFGGARWKTLKNGGMGNDRSDAVFAV